MRMIVVRGQIKCFLILTFGWLFLSNNAFATEDQELAKRYFKLGEELYNRSDYEGALKQFQASYGYSKKPALLFNIARCHESLGQHEEAVDTFEKFAASSPQAEAQVRARIENLKRLIEKKKQTETPRTTTPTPIPTPSTGPQAQTTTPTTSEPAPTATPVIQKTATQPAAQPSSTMAIIGWTAAGVGVATLAAGIALGVVAKSRASSLEEDFRTGQQYDPNKESQGKTFNVAGIACMVIGGVAVAAGTTLLVLHYTQKPKANETATRDIIKRTAWVAPSPIPGGAYVGGGFRF